MIESATNRTIAEDLRHRLHVITVIVTPRECAPGRGARFAGI
jgi:hypothetical protein